jgi:zeaxanthin glucosyltransferase
MARIGLICPEMSGHLNPICALGRELSLRGHHVSFLGFRDGEDHAQSAGLDYCPVGEREFPRGAWRESTIELGKLQALKAFRFTVERYKKSAEIFLRDLPGVVRELQLDGLIVDQTSMPGATVADRFQLPFVSVACALMMNVETSVPPIITPWSYRDTLAGRCRNRVGHFLFRRAIRSVPRLVNRYRRRWNLPLYQTTSDAFSRLAQIAQVPREFDFPRRDLPAWFHYTGPLSSPESRAAVAFPFEKLTGQPLIYASLGTLQNRLGYVFQTIVDACRGLEAQLVLSIGGGHSGTLQNVPGSALVVEFAPQLELLKRADLTITHAGMNTAMESLSQGVPMVCLPVTNDQPAIAARVAWTGSGEVVPLRKLTQDRLRDAVKTVLEAETYRQRAGELQAAMQRAGGLSRAADVVETAVLTGRPVLSTAETVPLAGSLAPVSP